MVTSPEVLHAGTPTSLAVTCLADFPARVTAELVHGDTRVAQAEDVHGGKARVDLHFNILNFTGTKVSFHSSRTDQSPHASPCE